MGAAVWLVRTHQGGQHAGQHVRQGVVDLEGGGEGEEVSVPV